MAINFFNEDISWLVRRKRVLRQWINQAIEKEGMVAGDLNFILCKDDYLLKLNIKYLRHNTLTDILTFPLINENGLVGGDIFISLPRVRENALIFREKIEDELHRVMIHGVLHLVGYADRSKADKTRMREKENFYMNLLDPA